VERLFKGEAYCLTGYGITIHLPNNNSALDNIALRTASAYTTLIYPISLSSKQSRQTRPYALIFSFDLQK
jgi:hypothetical protein